jgi:hypothetical protein
MKKETTLEQAAERLYPVNNTGSMFMASRDELNNILKQESFVEGAKWQQERSYSEEEVIELLNKREDYINQTSSIFDYISAKEWFNKFKNK